jgi:tetrahydromethanopterin S-methyltransferase subunit A
MNKRDRKHLRNFVENWWSALRTWIEPEDQHELRKIVKQCVRRDEKEYKEFVELMGASKEDVANKKLQESAHDAADERQAIEDGVVTHQCHYCCSMYHINDLSGCKEGLICYKCRHEMENRDADVSPGS